METVMAAHGVRQEGGGGGGGEHGGGGGGEGEHGDMRGLLEGLHLLLQTALPGLQMADLHLGRRDVHTANE